MDEIPIDTLDDMVGLDDNASMQMFIGNRIMEMCEVLSAQPDVETGCCLLALFTTALERAAKDIDDGRHFDYSEALPEMGAAESQFQFSDGVPVYGLAATRASALFAETVAAALTHPERAPQPMPRLDDGDLDGAKVFLLNACLLAWLWLWLRAAGESEGSSGTFTEKAVLLEAVRACETLLITEDAS